MTEKDIKKIRVMIEFLVKERILNKVNKLSSDEKKIYFLTGENGQVKMVKSTGFAAGKISKIWKKLESEGLLIKEGTKYRKVI